MASTLRPDGTQQLASAHLSSTNSSPLPSRRSHTKVGGCRELMFIPLNDYHQGGCANGLWFCCDSRAPRCEGMEERSTCTRVRTRLDRQGHAVARTAVRCGVRPGEPVTINRDATTDVSVACQFGSHISVGSRAEDASESGSVTARFSLHLGTASRPFMWEKPNGALPKERKMSM